MRNRFTVTITDIEGSKHYNLHQLVKKFIIYFTLFVLAVITFGGWFIFYLSKEVSSLEKKKNILTRKEIELSSTNIHLQKLINTKSSEYQTLKDKVVSIEELVGIRPSKDMTMDERLEQITLSNKEQKEMFKVVPSGFILKHNGISAPFGWRKHPILNKKEFHPGIDLRATLKTPIYAPANGVVEFAGFHKNGFGYLVIIDHNFGFQTRYAHLSKKIPVKVGHFVKKGDLIAYSGNSGLSTGPHLHYEVRFLGRILDPLNFLKWKSNNFKQIFQKEKSISWQSLIKIVTGKQIQQTTKPQS